MNTEKRFSWKQEKTTPKSERGTRAVGPYCRLLFHVSSRELQPNAGAAWQTPLSSAGVTALGMPLTGSWCAAPVDAVVFVRQWVVAWLAAAAAVLSSPWWLPPRIIKVRMYLFTKINGDSGTAGATAATLPPPAPTLTRIVVHVPYARVARRCTRCKAVSRLACLCAVSVCR